MTPEMLTDWVRRYRVAWESNDPQDIGSIFSAEAEYLTEPYAEPWRGRDEIVARWIEAKDEPGDTDFEFEVAVISGEYGIVRGTTGYKTPPPRTYSNMWEVTLDETGRCSRFVEWWMKHDSPAPSD